MRAKSTSSAVFGLVVLCLALPVIAQSQTPIPAIMEQVGIDQRRMERVRDVQPGRLDAFTLQRGDDRHDMLETAGDDHIARTVDGRE